MFITFRLADSLHRAIVAALQEEHELEERALLRLAQPETRAEKEDQAARSLHFPPGPQEGGDSTAPHRPILPYASPELRGC